MKKIDQRKRINEMMSKFMPVFVLGAAAELDVFTFLSREKFGAEQVAQKIGANLRGTTALLDALAALGFLLKNGENYSVPKDLVPLLSEDSDDNILPSIRHRERVLRNWSQLAWVTKTGNVAEKKPSIRGEEGDRASFIGAMHNASGPFAKSVVKKLGPPSFKHLLDVGGASGTWTIAFLSALPKAQATLFDMPDAIQQARERFFSKTEFSGRISFVGGDFYKDQLPSGADFAWVSAIIHQHSRKHNCELYKKVFDALVPGGKIAIRDFVMDSTRTKPAQGALFAINMLVATETGGTFTFDEISEDLKSVGFVRPQLKLKSEDMNSVVVATKP